MTDKETKMLLSDIKIYIGMLFIVIGVNLADLSFKYIATVALTFVMCCLAILDILQRSRFKEANK